MISRFTLFALVFTMPASFAMATIGESDSKPMAEPLLLDPAKLRKPLRRENDHLAIARAEAVNMAIASFIAAKGRKNAIATWAKLKTHQSRYAALAPFLAFAPPEWHKYMPRRYSILLPRSLEKLSKVRLTSTTGVVAY